MSQSPRPCSRCQGSMMPVTLEPFTAEEGGVRVRVEAMPALDCGQGHRRLLYAAFGSQLMELVGDASSKSEVPAGVKKGLLLRHYHCSSCGEELETEASGVALSRFRPQLEEGPAFGVEVEHPLWKCRGCGAEQSYPAEETAALVVKALARGLRTAGVHSE